MPLDPAAYDWTMLCRTEAPLWRSFQCDLHGSHDDIAGAPNYRIDLERLGCCIFPFNDAALDRLREVKSASRVTCDCGMPGCRMLNDHKKSGSGWTA